MTAQTQTQDVLLTSVRAFIEATAAKQPTPGGGSVAGVVGGLAVALGEMALNFTKGKKKFAEHEAVHAHLSERLARAREMFAQLVYDDIQAYSMYQNASRMDAGTEKDQAAELALAAAINVPREMAKLALAVMEDLAGLVDKCNPYLISDLTAAAALAVAVVRLCDYNVGINTPNLTDRQAAQDIQTASKTDRQRADKLLQQIETDAAKH